MVQKLYDAAIIGAGASGLMAAVTAARNGRNVILLEHMDQAGKKILATGNGKCNYTNLNLSPEFYYCEDPSFVQTVLEQFSCLDTIRFFEELGIRPLQKNGTCIYPESEQAVSVKNVLTAEIERLKVPLRLSVGIRSIQKQGQVKTGAHLYQDVFEIQTKELPVYCRSCILAAGGMAAKKTGSDGSGYIYAKQLGHTVARPLPALTALKADFSKRKLPAGVRIRCAASLYVDGEIRAREQGELQITDYGLSGIVIFQFSRIAARALAENSSVQVSLDLKPDMAGNELEEYLEKRFQSLYLAHKKCRDSLTGFLPDKLAAAVLLQSGFSENEKCGSYSRKQVRNLARWLKDYQVQITGTKDFDFAQVTTGGVPVSEIRAENMESRLVSGLFFAGEIVDTDAKCGGYNLQWAWSSGYVAGRSI